MKMICNEECTIRGSSLKEKGWALLTSVLALFMPKCAFCWAVYMSIFSSAGLVIAYQPWFLPVSLALFLITLIKLLIIAIRRKSFISFGLALLAGLLIISQRSAAGIDGMKIAAFTLMTAAILMDNFLNLYKQLMLHFRNRRDSSAEQPEFY